MKTQKLTTAPATSNNKPGEKFRAFAYYMAWIGFIGNLAIIVRDAVKTHEPPQKDEYYK